MQIQKIVGKVVQFLPKTEGAAARIHLGEKQIGEILKKSGSRPEVNALKEWVGGLKRPSVDVACKVKSNYTIAGLQLREGNDVVGNTVVSIVNAGGKNPIVKARVSLGKGSDTLYANGFVDAGQTADSRDVAMGLIRKDGKVKADTTISKAAEAHVQLDEDKVIDFVHKLPNGDNVVSKYKKGQLSLQHGLDEALANVRAFLTGGQVGGKSTGTIAETAEKVESKLTGTVAETVEKVATKITPEKGITKFAPKKGITKFAPEKGITKIAGDQHLGKVERFKPDRPLKGPSPFKINEFGEVEYKKAAEALKGKTATKARTAAERFKKAFGVTRRTYMNRLKKAKAAGDSVTFEKLRAEMGQKGYQPYFDRHTGALKIMEGAYNMEDVLKRLG